MPGEILQITIPTGRYLVKAKPRITCHLLTPEPERSRCHFAAEYQEALAMY
jgi:hypothetical protein